MKARSLREQTDEELAQVMRETSKTLFDLKVRKTTSEASEQPLKRRTLRRDIARIKTLMRERKAEGNG